MLSLGAVMALGLAFILAQDVEAKNESEFLPVYEATYPAAVGSRIESCTHCHLSLIHISEPTRQSCQTRMPASA